MAPFPPPDAPIMSDLAANLRRLMARFDMTADQVVDATRLDPRTIKGILAGRNPKPHARTLHKLATGLGVATDELFQNPSVIGHRLLDRETNPLIEDVVADCPALFDGWTAAEFDELYSRVGTGGPLTRAGAIDVAEDMNRKREIHYRLDLLLESDQADVLIGFIDLLYEKARATPD